MRQLDLLWIGVLAVSWAAGGIACSDNEATLPPDGAGGTKATGGSGNNGGGGSSTTGSVGGGGSGNSQIGTECESNKDCATGLECLTSRSKSLTVGGPAHGFCTFVCGEADTTPSDADAECQKVDRNSLCHYFDDNTAFCVQRCTFGVSQKCQGRDDVACDVVLHEAPGAIRCQSDDDCDIGDGCLVENEGDTEGVCYSVPQVCLPRCNSDNDCPADRFCDPRSGECMDDEPTGKRFDEPCDPDAEVDECAGFCASDGFCVEKCILGSYPACGSTSNTEATGDCFFRAFQDTDDGDVGLCGGLCDCNADCRGGLDCVQIANDEGPFEYRGRSGYCAPSSTGDVILEECDGTGGTGGTSAGGGAAGQGGSP